MSYLNAARADEEFWHCQPGAEEPEVNDQRREPDAIEPCRRELEIEEPVKEDEGRRSETMPTEELAADEVEGRLGTYEQEEASQESMVIVCRCTDTVAEELSEDP